jgi:hypothetical protein
LAEAKQIYRKIIEEVAPDHFDATHLLEVVLLQPRQLVEGEQSIETESRVASRFDLSFI